MAPCIFGPARVLASAPEPSSSSTTLTWPLAAARMRAVTAEGAGDEAEAFAPARSMVAQVASSPVLAATSSASVPRESAERASAPCDNKASTTAASARPRSAPPRNAACSAPPSSGGPSRGEAPASSSSEITLCWPRNAAWESGVAPA